RDIIRIKTFTLVAATHVKMNRTGSCRHSPARGLSQFPGRTRHPGMLRPRPASIQRTFDQHQLSANK
ncbi:MAG: hypothetical protein WA212_02740, partial [Candidatus Acidiferrales bacterium]